MFQEGISRTSPGGDQISEIARQYYQFAKKYPLYRHTFDIAGQLGNLELLYQKKSPELVQRSEKIKKRLQVEQKKFIGIWANTIEQAQQTREVSSKYSSFQLAFVLGTIMTGLVDELMVRKEWAESVGLTTEKVLEMAIEFLTTGIQKKK
jgi:hypothetical protein